MILFSIAPIESPQGYPTIGTSVVAPSTTQVACCPSGYGFKSLFQAGIVGECTSVIGSGSVVTFAMLKSTSSADGPNIITSTTLTAPKTVMAVPINGYNFAFDIMSVTPTPSLNSQPGTNIPSPGLSPTTSAFSAGSTTPSTGIVASAELSTGAKAGIGVAVALVGILIVGVSVFAWRRRHLRQARLVQGVANNKLVAAVEKDSSTMHEMPHTGSSQPRVFQPPSSPQELHG